jgi:phosphoribosylformylglycinamidine cyclo-ligase
MYNTFNMGIGMVLTVSAAQVEEAVRVLKGCGEDPRVIGEIVPGDERVTLI